MQNHRRPLVAQAFRPANGRRAALKGGATCNFATRSKGLRYLAAAGGVVIAALGASSVYRMLSGPHFEGYALVLGSAMVLQGALTIGAFAELQHFRMAGGQE